MGYLAEYLLDRVLGAFPHAGIVGDGAHVGVMGVICVLSESSRE